MAIPQDQDLRWSLDFVMDTLVSGRRFSISLQYVVQVEVLPLMHALQASMHWLSFSSNRFNRWPMQTRC
jgi:hypothetical protein